MTTTSLTYPMTTLGPMSHLTQDTNVPKLDVNSPRYYDPRSVPTGPVAGDVRTSVIGIPLGHMTKAERKRIEWERQRGLYL
jgi:hypothetical protein